MIPGVTCSSPVHWRVESIGHQEGSQADASHLDGVDTDTNAQDQSSLANQPAQAGHRRLRTSSVDGSFPVEDRQPSMLRQAIQKSRMPGDL
jgi:hypothetical protein